MNSQMIAAWGRQNNASAAALAAARARLAESHARYERRTEPTKAIYYPSRIDGRLPNNASTTCALSRWTPS